MKAILTIIAAAVALLPLQAAGQSEDGQALFATKGCVACHTVGSGRLVGPDLAGLSARREKSWTIQFIKSPQAMISAGDARAVQLFNEYGQIVMPNPGLNDAQIEAVLAYIGAWGAGNAKREGDLPSPGSVTKGGVEAVAQPTDDDITQGQDLFQGKLRFQNGGAPCISCHHVKNDAVIGGGILAKDLTMVFSRLGGPGVRAIIGSPPFPVMQQAYLNHALTPQEVFSLVAFLERADKEQAFQRPMDYGVLLLCSGIGGTAILFGLYTLVGSGRKKESVYEDIHRRQIRSE